MNVWVVQLFEECHLDVPRNGLMRSGHLCDELERRGHRVRFWVSRFSHFRKKHRDGPAHRVVRSRLAVDLIDGPGYFGHRSVRRLWHHFRSAATVRRQLARETEPPDLIVCCNFPVEVTSAFADYARKHGVPLAVDVVDIWPDSFVALAPQGLGIAVRILSWYQRRISRKTFRFARLVTAVSRTYWEWAKQNGAASDANGENHVFPLVSFYETEPHEHDRLATKSRLHLAPTDFVAIFAGTLGATYDIETLCECGRLLRESSGGIRLIVAGDGDKAPAVKEAAGRGDLIYLGWLEKDELGRVLAASDVGLCAYVRGAPQSLPSKPFDYIAAGLPIVSSLTGELADVIRAGRWGVQYPAGDAEMLKQVLLQLKQDRSALEAMSAAAKKAAADHYGFVSSYRNFGDCLLKAVGD